MSKEILVIAGPNGAGKTTFARKFLPLFGKCEAFVNADLIAKGLSPYYPDRMAVQAGRLMLQRLHGLSRSRKSFAFETTLSGKAYQPLLKRWKKSGYRVRLFFLWLPTPNLAVKRVSDRVRMGGHNIPEDTIRRRYDRGIVNLWTRYRPLLNDWIIFDNSENQPVVIAYGDRAEHQAVDADRFKALERFWRPYEKRSH